MNKFSSFSVYYTFKFLWKKCFINEKDWLKDAFKKKKKESYFIPVPESF